MATTLGNPSLVTQVQWPKVSCGSYAMGCSYQVRMNRPGNKDYAQPAATTLIFDSSNTATVRNPKLLSDIIFSQKQQTSQGASALDAIQIQMFDSFTYSGTINSVPISENFATIPDTALGQWLNVKGTAYLPLPYYLWIDWFDANGNKDICFVGLYDALQKVQPYQWVLYPETATETLRGSRNLQVVSAGQLPAMTLWKDVLALIDKADCAQGDFYNGYFRVDDTLFGYSETRDGIFTAHTLNAYNLQQAVPYIRTAGNAQAGDPGQWGHVCFSCNKYGASFRSNAGIDNNNPWPSQRSQANWQNTPLRLPDGAAVASGGSGYSIGDTFSINGYSILPAICVVTSVASGVVTGFNVTNGGQGYIGYPLVAFLPPQGTTTITGIGIGLTVNIVYVEAFNWGPWGTWGILILTLLQKCCAAMGYATFSASDLQSALDHRIQVLDEIDFCFPVHPTPIPITSQWVSFNLLSGSHPYSGQQDISPASLDPNEPIAALLQGIWDYLLVDAQTVVDQSSGKPKFRLTPYGSQDGILLAASITSGGNGYVVGDTGFFVDISAGVYSATYVITTIGGSGAVTGFTIAYGGFGYVGSDALAGIAGGPQPGIGTGFTLTASSVTQHLRPKGWKVGEVLSEESPSISTVSVSVHNKADSLVIVAPLLQVLSQSRGTTLTREVRFRHRRIGMAVPTPNETSMLDLDSYQSYDPSAGQVQTSTFDVCDMDWDDINPSLNSNWWIGMTGVYLYTQDSLVMDCVYAPGFWGAFNNGAGTSSPNGDGYGSGSYTTGSFLTLGAQYAAGSTFSKTISSNSFGLLFDSSGKTTLNVAGTETFYEQNYARFDTRSYQAVVLANYLVPGPTALKRNYLGIQADDGTISSLTRGFFNSFWYDGQMRTFRAIEVERHLRDATTPVVRYQEVPNNGAFPDITSIPYGAAGTSGGTNSTVDTGGVGNGSGNGATPAATLTTWRPDRLVTLTGTGTVTLPNIDCAIVCSSATVTGVSKPTSPSAPCTLIITNKTGADWTAGDFFIANNDTWLLYYDGTATKSDPTLPAGWNIMGRSS